MYCSQIQDDEGVQNREVGFFLVAADSLLLCVRVRPRWLYCCSIRPHGVLTGHSYRYIDNICLCSLTILSLIDSHEHILIIQ
jgi:hypothetical protein